MPKLGKLRHPIGSYRLISLLLNFNKLYEGLLLHFLLDHQEQANIVPNEVFADCAAVFCRYPDMANGFTTYKQSMLIALDISKAFGKVNHQSLMYWLEFSTILPVQSKLYSLISHHNGSWSAAGFYACLLAP